MLTATALTASQARRMATLTGMLPPTQGPDVASPGTHSSGWAECPRPRLANHARRGQGAAVSWTRPPPGALGLPEAAGSLRQCLLGSASALQLPQTLPPCLAPPGGPFLAPPGRSLSAHVGSQ